MSTKKPEIKQQHQHWVTAWLASGAFWIALLVLVGGLTRLNEAGLSITEWEVISGIVPPVTEEQWDEAFAKYREIPEYQELRGGMSLEEFQTIYWWEWSHRMLARGLGILFIVPFGFYWWKGWLSRPLIRQLKVIVALGLLQGLAGWYLVRSGLADQPYVTPWRLSLHLGLGFIIFGLLWRLVLQRTLIKEPARSDASGISPIIRWTAFLLPVLILIQVMAGGLVSGMQAAYVYPTFPTMGGYWIPPELGLYGSVWSDILNNAITAQWIHRMMGWLLLALAIIVAAALFMRKPADGRLKVWTGVYAGVLILQIALGAFLLLAGNPDGWASVHQMVALAVFAVTIGLAMLMNNRLPANAGEDKSITNAI